MTSAETSPETRQSLKRWTLSLRARLATAFTLLFILAISLTISVLYFNFSAKIRDDLRRRITSFAAVAALQQNGDELARITSANDPLYEKYRLQNLKIRRLDPEIAYVYTISKDTRGYFFLVDAGEIGEGNIAAFGERYPDPSTTLIANYDTMENAIAVPEIYTDSYGSFLSAYAPIFDRNGQRVAVIGVDFLADTVLAKEREFLTIAFILFIISLPLIMLTGWLLGNAISGPLSALAQSANQIAAGDLGRRVEVRTGSTEIVELANDFNSMADALSGLVQGLEDRVAERTNSLNQRTVELEKTSAKMERRADQLRAVAQVARAISSVQKLEELLPRITTLVSEAFGFYHTGIFLLDETRENAVLAASNSSGGQRMLERGHQIPVGQAGIVGFTAGSGLPRIAQETELDEVFIDHPDLPETRSEMALPLLVAGTVIGVLDVQSEQTKAFDEEDIELLGIVADQVSIAIQNANQFQAAQKATLDAEEVYKKYIRQAWQILVREERRLGYRSSRAGVGPLKAPSRAPEIEAALSSGQIQVAEREGRGQLSIPIRLRGQVIGTLNVQTEGKHFWDQDEIDISAAAADRVALALENARLLDASQSQAAREHTLSEITSRISDSVEMETLLQIALTELGRILPDSAVSFQLGNENATQGDGEKPEFRYTISGTDEAAARASAATLQRVTISGEVEFETGEKAFLAVPIRLRDEGIGAVKIDLPGKQLWKSDEISVVQAIVERIAISAENARLFEETRRRAAREKIIGEITAKIGASINVRNVLQTTVTELARAIPGAEVLVQFQNMNADKPETDS